MVSANNNATRPHGWSDRSYYLPMRDGVRLAISFYYPGGETPTKTHPVILVLTRYGRATGRTRNGPGSINPWLKAGYVGCVVDVRGTTASFGSRAAEQGPEEQQDVEEIIAHIVEQPWSNGKVVATGTSYSGNTADLAATRDAAGLVAVIPCAVDFDFYELFWPGGIRNDALLRAWGHTVYEIDFGRPFEWGGVVIYPQQAGLDGWLRSEDCLKSFPTLQPVDEDAAGCSLLQQALRSREDGGRHWTADDYNAASFRDDQGANGHSWFDSCAASLVPAIVQQAKPVQWWASWMDANTAEEAISRYLSAPEIPSVMIITAHNHPSAVRVDPLLPEQIDPLPTSDQQDEQKLQFADAVMNGRSPSRVIKYYVLGAGIFRESPTWPPMDTKETCLWLSDQRQLVPTAPVAGMDHYLVNPKTTTGKANRWNQTGTPSYGDRRIEDEKLLCYDSAPMESAVEIAGWPILTLQISTQTDDPTVFAYLEDISPHGRVTYITEGILRLVNRKIAPTDALPFVQGPAPHTFNRKDALPVVPGSKMTVTFKLFATAARIQQGHRLRLAIAGADADTFRSAGTENEEESFDIFRGGSEASVLSLPLRHVGTI